MIKTNQLNNFVIKKQNLVKPVFKPPAIEALGLSYKG